MMSENGKRSKRMRWGILIALGPLTLAVVWGAVEYSERSYKKAFEMFNSKRYEEAGRAMRFWPGEFFATVDRVNDANALRAKIAMHRGRPEEARKWLRRLPAGSADRQATTFSTAAIAHSEGNLKFAESLLIEYIESDDDPSGKVASYLASLLWLQSRFEEAEPLYKRTLARTDSIYGTLYSKIANDQRALRPEQQIMRLRRILEKNPNEERAQLGLARMEILAGETETAKNRLKILMENPDRAVWLAWRDLAYATGDAVELARALTALQVPTTDNTWKARLRTIVGVPLSESDLESLGDSSEGLEKRAAYAAETGDTRRAAELRARKLVLDSAFEEYRRLLAGQARFHGQNLIKRLAELAERAGLPLEARAWRAEADSDATGGKSVGAFKLSIAQDLKLLDKLPHSSNPSETDWNRVLDEIKATAPSAVSPKSANVQETELEAISHPSFQEVTEASGIDFRYASGRSIIRQLPETMGGGLAWIDYDDDGHLDIYAVQGGPFGAEASRPRPGDRLFRNQGDGTFVDVTARAGLPAQSPSYGFGVTTGDFDGDGHEDIFVSRWRGVQLFRNQGDGTFRDVTDAQGLAEGWWWPTSAAFADIDDDGDLDLYVCQYLKWDENNPRICRDGTAGQYIACDPLLLEALPDRLFRNDGDRFVELANFGGNQDPPGRGLGVVAIDVDGDRRTDFFVANDKSPNKLYVNQGGGRFIESALDRGVAANSEGGFQAGMGVDAADIDDDGWPDLVVTNFFGEGTSVFRNLGNGQFVEAGKPSGITPQSRYLLGFGVALADFNADGNIDYVATNGHVNDMPDIAQAMPVQMLVSNGRGKFLKIDATSDSPLQVKTIGRALAYGDFDGDGMIDLALAGLDSPLRILKNTTPVAGTDRLTIRLRGSRSNRDGIGVRVKFTTEKGRSLYRFRTAGGSYQSANDARMQLAVRDDRIVHAEVRWPSGRNSEMAIAADQNHRTIVIEEP